MARSRLLPQGPRVNGPESSDSSRAVQANEPVIVAQGAGASSLRLADWVDVVDATAVSPAIVHAPHGGTTIPPWGRHEFVVSDGELGAELLAMTDHRVDEFARQGLRVAPASAVINRLSRFVVDVERFPGPEEEKNAVGMGVLYTHGSQRQLLRVVPEGTRGGYLAFFHAYSATLAELVTKALARHGRAVIIDVHSYHTLREPHELHGEEPRPPLCVGYEHFHMTSGLRAAVATAFGELDQGDNETFHGSYVPLTHYLHDARVQSVMLEIRRDQYMNEATGEVDDAAAGRIGQSLGALVAALNRA